MRPVEFPITSRLTLDVPRSAAGPARRGVVAVRRTQ